VHVSPILSAPVKMLGAGTNLIAGSRCERHAAGSGATRCGGNREQQREP
jgi:hypothetical protein